MKILNFLVIILLFTFTNISAQINENKLDDYKIEFVKTKVYSANTTIYLFNVENKSDIEKEYKVYVSDTNSGAKILVENFFDNTKNAYLFSNRTYVDNFYDTPRNTYYAVYSLKAAAEFALRHYLEDKDEI